MSDIRPTPPPVDRTARELVSGAPVPEDNSHTALKENGQQRDYVVLSAEERAKGFVRPVRRAYVHTGCNPVLDGGILIRPSADGCGSRTEMSQAIAETYARDPYFYSGTFCVHCGVHRPLAEFRWEDSDEVVGS